MAPGEGFDEQARATYKSLHAKLDQPVCPGSGMTLLQVGSTGICLAFSSSSFLFDMYGRFFGAWCVNVAVVLQMKLAFVCSSSNMDFLLLTAMNITKGRPLV